MDKEYPLAQQDNAPHDTAYNEVLATYGPDDDQPLFPEQHEHGQATVPPRTALSSHRTRQHPNGKRLLRMSIGFSLLTLFSSTVIAVLFVGQPVPPNSSQNVSISPRMTVGELAYTSSSQLDPTSSLGLNDRVTLQLDHLSRPTAGKSFYAWFMPDKTNDDVKPLLLGSLLLSGGKAHLDYNSPDNINLLTMFSGFRVTEQESTPLPTTPSLDPNAVRYVGSIPNIPTPGDEKQYSLLDHLRHLLAKDPTLTAIGLSGGLDIWLYRNSGKIGEYVTAIQGDWADKSVTDQMHRQIVRVLDYLDGINYVWQDVPAKTPFLVDPLAGHLGLLDMTPTQNPPGYLVHVDIHLQGLANSPGHTEQQRQLAIRIDQALSEVAAHLLAIHKDAVQLVRMSSTQLHQPEALKLTNEMVSNSISANTGQLDSKTGENTGGVVWIHSMLQGLASMVITTPTKEDQ